MLRRPNLLAIVALFVASAAIVGLLPLLADLLWGPEIAHPPPSQAERLVAALRELLFCITVLFAYLMWLQHRSALLVLRFTCFAIAGLTLLSPYLSRVRYLYSNPVFDPVAGALEEALPWFFLGMLLCHPVIGDAFISPKPLGFSIRYFLISLGAYFALLVSVGLLPIPDAVDDALRTFLLLPAKICVGLAILAGAGRRFLDSWFYSTLWPLFGLVGSAVFWSCIIALIWPHIPRGPQTSNQSMQPTTGRSDA